MRARRAVALLLGAALALTGCATDADVDTAPEIEAVSEQLRLPMPYDEREVLDPKWDLAPIAHPDGILGGSVGSTELTFTAISTDGTPLWRQARPLSCSGFTVTSAADGSAVAVLTDLQSTTTAVSQTTASGYDLASGELLWGPVEVPGPLRGPGAVFAFAPKSVMGDNGPRLALDPSTGAVIFDERMSDATLIGEYAGTLLIEEPGILRGLRADGAILWEVDSSEWGGAIPSVTPPTPIGGTHALVQTRDAGGVLLDLASGEAVSLGTDVAASDPATGALVVLGDDGLRSIQAEGTVAWAVTVPPSTQFHGAAEAFVYTESDGVVHVHNVMTGQAVQPYANDEGRITVPVLALPDGAAILAVGGRLLLAAAPAGM